MKRPTYEDFKKEALKNPEVKKAYDALEDEYKIKRELIRMRKKSGLTQEELAKKLKTKKSNISRLESFNAKSSPRILTLMEYAKATGHKMKIEFVE
jgi:ribosome-binding protein aMBF1 (putative translation factor)